MSDVESPTDHIIKINVHRLSKSLSASSVLLLASVWEELVEAP